MKRENYINVSYSNNTTASFGTATVLNISGSLPTATRNAIPGWLAANSGNILMFVGDLYQHSHNNYLSTIGYTNVVDDDIYPKVAATPPAGILQKKLWDYVMNSPFGTVNPAALNYNGDAYGGGLTVMPSSAVAILVQSNSGRVQQAIDPVNRVIYVGNSDMFGSNTPGTFAMDLDNAILIRNVLAFMVNASQYGATFLDDFP